MLKLSSLYIDCLLFSHVQYKYDSVGHVPPVVWDQRTKSAMFRDGKCPF